MEHDLPTSEQLERMMSGDKDSSLIESDSPVYEELIKAMTASLCLYL